MSSQARTTIVDGPLFDGVSPLRAEATIVVEGENIMSITGPSAAEPGPADADSLATRIAEPILEVRRARFGPGLWPGPRRQARWGGRGLWRSRVGPEDRFCEAVRNDLRVPLTLEGPTRTMRGVPA